MQIGVPEPFSVMCSPTRLRAWPACPPGRHPSACPAGVPDQHRRACRPAETRPLPGV